MPGRVHANPDDLKRLRQTIDRAQREIAQAVQSMKLGLARTDWDDAGRRKFEERLDQTVASIRRFDQAASELKPYLDRKARELEAYLR
ncbi:hypothetical protein [Pseudonocardia xishanensis]|uniref:WXG100 family type VII secretion target n=1 Tax=Pseudonocardia xishanensis TaxID=630995 RepID=A0ABP8RCI6_9PSEU